MVNSYELTLYGQRVLVARVASCPTVEEAYRIADEVRGVLVRVPGSLVATADFRSARLFSQPVTDAIVTVLKSDNERLERSAHLVSANDAVFALQLERMVRAAGNPRRRVFRTVKECEDYLGEVLTIEQRQWLHAWYLAGEAADVYSRA